MSCTVVFVKEHIFNGSGVRRIRGPLFLPNHPTQKDGLSSSFVWVGSRKLPPKWQDYDFSKMPAEALQRLEALYTSINAKATGRENRNAVSGRQAALFDGLQMSN